MKIFEFDGRVHLQLMDMNENRMLFNFSVEKAAYATLRDHIIEHLLAFKLEVPK